MKKIVVTAGANASDIDVLACVVAYAELLKLEGKESLAVVPGSFTMSVPASILSWNPVFEKTYSPTGDELFTVVDICDPEAFPAFVDIERMDEVYDHRAGHEDFWKNKIGGRAHIEMVGACGTLIWEEYKKRGFSEAISSTSAKLLLASIVSNTLNFKGPITVERDREAYKELSAITGLGETWIENYFIEQEQTLLGDFKNYVSTDTKLFHTKTGDFVVSQIELWDAQKVLAEKKDEIVEAIGDLTQYPWILNIPSISQGYNYIYSTHPEAKKIIEEKLRLSFEGDIAKTEKLTMRKEIMKLLNNL